MSRILGIEPQMLYFAQTEKNVFGNFLREFKKKNYISPKEAEMINTEEHLWDIAYFYEDLDRESKKTLKHLFDYMKHAYGYTETENKFTAFLLEFDTYENLRNFQDYQTVCTEIINGHKKGKELNLTGNKKYNH